MNPDASGPRALLRRTALVSLLAGLAAAAFCARGFSADPHAFFIAYLMAFLFWTGIIAGALPVLMIHNLTGGAWGFPVRKILEAVLRMVPWLLVLFLPLVYGLRELYVWADPARVIHDAVLVQKQAYLNVPFFLMRTAFYFAVWFLLAFGLVPRPSRKRYIREDRGTRNGLGLALYALTITFSSVDWAMSAEPHWNSTIYGLIFMIGQTLSGFAFAFLTALLLAGREPFRRTLVSARTLDLATLLFVFVMLWAYVSLSQFIIIWSGNLAETTPWYVRRFERGWAAVGIFLVLFDFAAPFFLLLMRKIKSSRRAVALICLWLLAMRWLSLFWYIKPAFHPALNFHWLDPAVWLAMSAFSVALFTWILSKKKLTVDRDPLWDGGNPHA